MGYLDHRYRADCCSVHLVSDWPDHPGRYHSCRVLPLCVGPGNSHSHQQKVIETIEQEQLDYMEVAACFEIRHKRVQDWERIYLTSGPESFKMEHRGCNSKERPAKLPKKTEEDLLSEVQRLRAEVAHLKNWQALVSENEQRQRKKRR